MRPDAEASGSEGGGVCYTARFADRGLATSFVWSGGSAISLRAASGVDEGMSSPFRDDDWHGGRMRRIRHDVGIFIDTRQGPLRLIGHPKYEQACISFDLDPGKRIRIRHFALTAEAN